MTLRDDIIEVLEDMVTVVAHIPADEPIPSGEYADHILDLIRSRRDDIMHLAGSLSFDAPAWADAVIELLSGHET